MRLRKDVNTAQARSQVRFMLLGLVALAWLAMPNRANAGCGYYVIIGHPTSQAAEQAGMRQAQLPLEHAKAPCDGPQCRKQNHRPMAPADLQTVIVHDLLGITTTSVADEQQMRLRFEDSLLLSDPHVWRIDPPPRT